MKRCVVTGGSGLIGSHLLPVLAARYEVHATTRRLRPDVGAGVKWHVVDLNEPGDLQSLPNGVDCVVYLAQSEHFREFPEKASSVFGVNVASVARFLEYARRAGARSFVLASSGGVYAPGDALLTEDLEISTRTDLGFYLGTKLCSEILAEQYAKLFTVSVLRFFFVYGPGQKPYMLIPRLVRSVLTDSPITLAGTDGIRINPTFVTDAVHATLSAVELTESHRINIGGPEAVSLRELCERIGAVVGKTPHFVQNSADAPGNLIADVSKMRELLYTPRIGIEEGIARLLDHTPRRAMRDDE